MPSCAISYANGFAVSRIRPYLLAPLLLATVLAGCDNFVTNPNGGSSPLPGWQFAVLGTAHTCGVYEDGKTYCWGDDRWGQLGAAGEQNATCTVDAVSNPCRATPLAIDGHAFFSLAAGPYFTCGVADDGTYCWGTATRLIGRDSSNVPVKLANVVFADIASGPEHICGIDFGGAVYCLEPGATPGSLQARVMNTNSAFAAFSGSGSHFCVLTVYGFASCWGENSSGELGIGSADADLHPAAEDVSTQLQFRRISAGFGSSCALTADRLVYCWGNRPYTGTTESDSLGSLLPQQVVTDLRFSAISVGRGFACGIDAAFDSYCWGTNDSYQLGSGGSSRTPHSTPQLVAGGHKFRFISTGEYHACGIDDAGDMYCWGVDDAGQLGSTGATEQCGPKVCSATPLLVPRPLVALALGK